MHQFPPPPGRGPGSLGSHGTLLLAAALIGAFLLAPQLYAFSIDWVLDYAADSYGGGLGGLVEVLWGLACALITFGLSKFILSTGLRLGLTKLLQAIFPNRY